MTQLLKQLFFLNDFFGIYYDTNVCVTVCWQIYTDWANHYLEKVKSKRRIQDLPNDVTDGVILADVIEAVGKLIPLSV
jgi:hypothetical protein